METKLDGEVRGFFDPVGDYTRGPDQRILAKGNALSKLIC
jgi:hypothetical protein